MSANDERELEALRGELAGYRAMTAPDRLRARVRGEIMTAPVVSEEARPRWVTLLRPLLASLVAVAVLAGASGVAAAGSVPGDPTFALKRAFESARVAIAPSETARLDELVAQATGRLADIETVAAHRPSAVPIAVDEYVAALTRVQSELAIVARQPATPERDAAVARARSAIAAHLERLRALENVLPAAAQKGIERAIDAQQRLHGNGNGQPAVTPTFPGSPAGPHPGQGSGPSGSDGSGSHGAGGGALPGAAPTAHPSRTGRPASPTRP